MRLGFSKSIINVIKRNKNKDMFCLVANKVFNIGSKNYILHFKIIDKSLMVLYLFDIGSESADLHLDKYTHPEGEIVFKWDHFITRRKKESLIYRQLRYIILWFYWVFGSDDKFLLEVKWSDKDNETDKYKNRFEWRLLNNEVTFTKNGKVIKK